MGKDPSEFFPRCFDVNDVAEFENFFEDFKFTQAQAILKNYIKSKGLLPVNSSIEVCFKAIEVCLAIVERQFLNLEEKLNWISNGKPIYITPK